MTREEKINYLLENFDFDKVRKVMEFLEWKWWSGEVGSSPEVPGMWRIFKAVEEHLNDVYDTCLATKKNYKLSTGGFSYEAFYYPKDEGGIYLSLSFVVTSMYVE